MLGLGKDDKVRIIKISDSTLKTTPAINVSTSFHEGYAKFLLHRAIMKVFSTRQAIYSAYFAKSSRFVKRLDRFVTAGV